MLGGLLVELVVVLGALTLWPQPPAQAQPAGALGSWPLTLVSGGSQPATWNFSNALGIDPVTNAAQPGRAGLALQEAVLDISPTLYALDASLVVSVDGQQFVAPDTVTATASTIATGEIDLAGLRAAIDFAALTTRPTLRTLISLRNPQSVTMTVSVAFASNVGAGANALSTLATGGPALTPADAWLVTSDSATIPAPDVLHVFFGPLRPPGPAAADQIVFEDQGPEGAVVTYTVSLPPAVTQRLLFFTELGAPGTGVAAAAAYAAPDQTSDLFTGLTQTERQQVINWFGHRTYLPLINR